MDFIKRQSVLAAATVGFEFEAFSRMSTQKVARELGRHIGKKIIVPKIEVGLHDYRKVHHSEDPVDANTFKIEPDFSLGQKNAWELVTGPMGLAEARIILIKVHEWIKKNGWTTDRCGIHVNMSFDKQKLHTRIPLEAMDPLTLCLRLDEEVVYEVFPHRRNSPYAATIKQIYPLNKFSSTTNMSIASRTQFKIPSEKYYGINFKKLEKGYLEFRYMGGKGYERRTSGILKIMEYFALTLHDCLENPTYTSSDTSKLRSIMEKHQKVVASFSDPEAFLLHHPNMMVLIDMKGDIQNLKTHWTTVREKLFDLIVLNGMKKGVLNYDKDISIYQVKDANLSKSFLLSQCEVFDSKIGGNVENCDVYNCEISDAQMKDCRIMGGNMIKESKVTDSPIHVGNEISDSYIDNHLNPIQGKLNRCIIRSGSPGDLCQLDESTEIIKTEPDVAKDSRTSMVYNVDVTKSPKKNSR